MGHSNGNTGERRLYLCMGVTFVDVLVAEVYQDYLFEVRVHVGLAEGDTVRQAEVVFWVAGANLVLCEVVEEGVIVVVALDHDAVDVFEAILAFYGVGYEHYSLPGRSFYQEAVIWHVVGDFKWLDGKSSDERFLSYWEGFYTPN